jgi:hypothetical protein
MTKKCYYKPNRTKPRRFTEKDVKRIAKYADNGSNKYRIAAEVLTALGLGAGFCIAAKFVTDYQKVIRIIKEVGSILAVKQVITVILRMLGDKAILAIPFVNRVAILAIVVVLAIEKVIDLIADVVEEAEAVDDVIDTLNNLCQSIREVSLN